MKNSFKNEIKKVCRVRWKKDERDKIVQISQAILFFGVSPSLSFDFSPLLIILLPSICFLIGGASYWKREEDGSSLRLRHTRRRRRCWLRSPGVRAQGSRPRRTLHHLRRISKSPIPFSARKCLAVRILVAYVILHSPLCFCDFRTSIHRICRRFEMGIRFLPMPKKLKICNNKLRIRSSSLYGQSAWQFSIYHELKLENL